jgi:probable F420-dependent oxidoreductase
MRVGVQLAQLGRQADPAVVRASARSAESLGYQSLWVIDRLLAPVAPRSPYPGSADGSLPDEQRTALDPLATLAFAAACTEVVRLGTNVLVAPWYRPVALARSLAAVDVLSGGRLTVGLGLGWSVDEYDALGVPPRDLAARQEELLDVLDVVWAGGAAEHRSPTVDLRPATVSPRPVQRPRPPILLAAYTPAGLERAGRRADGWTPAGLPVDALAPMFGVVRDAAAAHGRDPDRLELVVRANIHLTDRPAAGSRATYEGDVAQVVDDLVATGAAGAHEVLLALDGDVELDRSLDAYAALAEGVELRRAAA